MKIKKTFFIAALVALLVVIAGFQTASAGGGRKFYLTRDFNFTGADALNACAKGYHMASLFEILDVSNLIYNTSLGHTTDDSGFGPPESSVSIGWIRTGFTSSVGNFPGLANCLAWTSNSTLDSGTAVFISVNWTDSSTVISPWNAVIVSCDFEERVWCVQD